MAVPMRSTDFRSIVEPILNKAFDGVYDQSKDEWSEVFKAQTGIARSYHEEPYLYGFASAPAMPDGTAVKYAKGGVLYLARYLYQVYGLAFALTKVLVEDGDHIRIGRIFSESLAQALVETKETVCANILNRAFNTSYLGGDGAVLVGNNHPMISGTWSNLLTTSAVLSQTSTEQMIIQMRKAVDAANKKVNVMPDKFVVSPDNMLQAEVITKSILRTSTANNDINPVKDKLPGGIAVLSRLTSTTAWWIKAGNVRQGLQLMTRRPMEKSMEGDFETDSMRYKGTERYQPGWTDPRDLWGTPGT